MGELVVNEFEDEFLDFIVLQALDDIHREAAGDELAGALGAARAITRGRGARGLR